jgi:uncharacterized protein
VKIDLSLLESEPIRFNERLALEPERLDPDLLVDTVTVQLTGTVRSVGPGVHVDGSFHAEGEVTCARCLEPVRWQTDEEYAVEYRRRDAHPVEEELALDEGELDVAFLTDDVLDLKRLAAEQVLLALPMRVVCDDECAGLCPQCGANRNTAGACRCEPETDPRWEALRNLAGSDTTN